VDRRDFLKQSLLTGGIVLTGARCLEARPTTQDRSPRSRIVISRDDDLRTPAGGMDGARLAAMLDRGMQASFDCDSPVAAWERVVHPGEVVGLKINMIKDVTPIPHNGCRPRKRRRV